MRQRLLVGILALATLALGGCGLDVTLMGPEEIPSGQTANFQVKLTNISPCPVAGQTEGVIFLPFIPQSVLPDDMQELCGLLDITALSSSLAADGTFPVSAAREKLESAAGFAAAVSCSGPGVSCSSFEGLGVVCDVGDLAPDEMLTLTCTAQAGGPGLHFNIAASNLEAFGVCKAGPGQGDPCTFDADCGAGGECAPGICEGGTNGGNGCDDAGDCPKGMCTNCAENDGVGADCTETVVIGTAAPAPAVSTVGLVVLVAGLCGIAAFRLRRSLADRS